MLFDQCHHTWELALGFLIKKFEENKELDSHDFKDVDVNSIVASDSRSFGGRYLYHSIWNEQFF